MFPPLSMISTRLLFQIPTREGYNDRMNAGIENVVEPSCIDRPKSQSSSSHERIKCLSPYKNPH